MDETDINTEELIEAIASGVKEAFPEIEKRDVVDGISDGIASFMSDEINGRLIIQALSEGVRGAIWQMITNVTDSPCQDFYDAVTKGVKAAVLEISISEDIKKTP